MTAVSLRVRNRLQLIDAIASVGTQRYFARRAGVSPTAINVLTQGRRDTLTLDLAVRIEDVCGVPRGTLFVLSESESLAPYLPTAGVA